MSQISISQLKKLVSYDPKTGKFTSRAEPDGELGYLHRQGYRRIYLKGRSYAASHLAYFYMTGTWVTRVDPVDGNHLNLRWGNLHGYNKRTNGTAPTTPRTDTVGRVSRSAFSSTCPREVLARVSECFKSGNSADVGKPWMEALTLMGLLRRTQQSPGLWEITPDGLLILESAQ